MNYKTEKQQINQIQKIEEIKINEQNKLKIESTQNETINETTSNDSSFIEFSNLLNNMKENEIEIEEIPLIDIYKSFNLLNKTTKRIENETQKQIHSQETTKTKCKTEINKLNVSKDFKTSIEFRKQQRMNEQQKNQFYVLQQTFLISLLNKHFTIELQRPKKQATKLSQFFSILKIYNENERICFDDLVDVRCRELFRCDIENNISVKTAKRRLTTNRKIECIHLLEDVLLLLGEDLLLSKRFKNCPSTVDSSKSNEMKIENSNNSKDNDNEFTIQKKKHDKQHFQSVQAVYVNDHFVHFEVLTDILILLNGRIMELMNYCEHSLIIKKNTINLFV